jgi:hypothetical protein
MLLRTKKLIIFTTDQIAQGCDHERSDLYLKTGGLISFQHFEQLIQLRRKDDLCSPVLFARFRCF